MEKTSSISREFFGKAFPMPGKYVIDSVHSFAQFAVQHMIVGQVRGRFDDIAGTINIMDDPLMSSVEILIETASVNTNNKDRDQDLRSERFFNVEKFPQMTFVGTGIKTELDGLFTIDGALTVRDITRPIVLKLEYGGIINDPWGNIRAAFQARAEINRREFGLLADLERETGGLLVGKDVSIDVSAEIIYQNKQ